MLLPLNSILLLISKISKILGVTSKMERRLLVNTPSKFEIKNTASLLCPPDAFLCVIFSDFLPLPPILRKESLLMLSLKSQEKHNTWKADKFLRCFPNNL